MHKLQASPSPCDFATVAADSGPTVVPVELLHDCCRRHPSLRSCVHRDVLYPTVPVDGQLLLRVRVLVVGLHHLNCHLRRHRNGVLLLPALR